MRTGIPNAVVGDFDNDMDLDVYYAAATGSGASTVDLANVMLWNQGDGTFVANPLPAGATATLFGSRIEWLSPGKRGPTQQPMALQGSAGKR